MRIQVEYKESLAELLMVDFAASLYDRFVVKLYSHWVRANPDALWTEVLVELTKDSVRALSGEQPAGKHIFEYLSRMLGDEQGVWDEAINNFYTDYLDRFWLEFRAQLAGHIPKDSLWRVGVRRESPNAISLELVGSKALIGEVIDQLGGDKEAFVEKVYKEM